MTLALFDGLADLPIFNPDFETGPEPAAVSHLRREVRAADGIIIAAPEYAHGIPGGLKNALDWLVSGDEIPGMPIALFHASPRSAISRAALEEVLRTMSTVLVPDASVTVPLLGLSHDAAAGLLAQRGVEELLRAALQRFAGVILECRAPQD